MPDPDTAALIRRLEERIASLETKLAAKLDRTEFDSLTIKQGQRINISGQGKNITITATDQNSGAAGAGDGSSPGGDDSYKEGSWQSFTDCDGDSFDVWTRDFTPP